MNQSIRRPNEAGLRSLEQRLARDLDILGYPPANWVKQRTADAGQPLLDVAVIGAGMCGLTVAFSLLRQGIKRIQLLDRAAPGQEGPWVTYARMRTLRSPKHLTGPAVGIASLAFRSWYEAQWGDAAWKSLGRIPRSVWMDYLRWYRKVLDLPVRNHAEVTALRPLDWTRSDCGFALTVRSPQRGDAGSDRRETILCRKVVFATGREGMARPRIPPPFESVMGSGGYHSSDLIDFKRLQGKTVAVVGWAASAVDNAATALEAGATEVHMLSRRPEIPRINKAKSLVYAGFTEGYPAMSDRQRFQTLRYVTACGVAAPRDSVLRIAGFPGLHLHLGAEARSVQRRGEGISIDLGARDLTVSAVILGTGFEIDLLPVGPLAEIAGRVARWQDRSQLADEFAGDELLKFPYLGEGFEFIERAPGETPWLRDIYCFNHAAWLSHGYVSSDIPAVSDGAARLARALTRSLFLSDYPGHRQDLEYFVEPELHGDEIDAERWWPPL